VARRETTSARSRWGLLHPHPSGEAKTLKQFWSRGRNKTEDPRAAASAELATLLERLFTASQVLDVIVKEMREDEVWRDEVASRIDDCSQALAEMRKYHPVTDRERNFVASIHSYLITYVDGTVMADTGLSRHRRDMITGGTNTVNRATREIQTMSLLLTR
jgi:hypothetical protein